ncbi:MAG TPA: hypothetical protein VMD59_22195 [Acidimicrobiales bacterium]|nr:hypothetical protein [Acidimicrobiales bacterium]
MREPGEQGPGPSSRCVAAFAGRRLPPSAPVAVTGDPTDQALLEAGLRHRNAAELSPGDIANLLEGRLGLLSPEAFLHVLPALLQHSLDSFESLSVFSAELVEALTRPERGDIDVSFDRLARLPPPELRDPVAVELLRAQQLAWFDSGDPSRRFESRFAHLTADEGGAVLAYLEELRARHGDRFPFGELDTAIERYWARFR